MPKIVKLYHNGEEYLIDEYKEPPFVPGTDTMLYVPMKTDLLDHSGKSVSLTNTSVTLSDKTGYFNGSAHIQMPSNMLGSKSKFTISLWLKFTGSGSVNDSKIIDFGNGSSRFIIAYDYTDQYYKVYYGSSWQSTGYGTKNVWVHYVITASSGTVTQYINGVSKKTSTGFSSFASTYANIGNEWNNGASRYYKGYMSELIMENKVWTATEISNYYNETKADYGL